MFISFEGGEGCGKSTQAKLLRDYFISLGKAVTLTREPGGTALAEELRRVLLAGKGIDDPMTEFLLMNTARRDHVVNLIKKSLEENRIVISDRFFDSSYVYQGYVRGVPMEVIKKITELSIGDFTPNITFLLDIDPQISLQRVKNKRGAENHYDEKNLDFYIEIREGFLNIAKKFPERIRIINANQTQDQVFASIKAIIDKA